MKQLDNFSDEELRKELDRRNALAERERARKHADKVHKFSELLENNFAALEALSLLLPEHSRTTCQDDRFLNHVNANRCTRCTFNWLIEQRDFEAIVVRFHLAE